MTSPIDPKSAYEASTASSFRPKFTGIEVIGGTNYRTTDDHQTAERFPDVIYTGELYGALDPLRARCREKIILEKIDMSKVSFSVVLDILDGKISYDDAMAIAQKKKAEFTVRIKDDARTVSKTDEEKPKKDEKESRFIMRK